MAKSVTGDTQMPLGARTFGGWNLLTRRIAQILTLCALGGVNQAHPAAGVSEPFAARFSLTTKGAKIGQTEWSVKSVATDIFVYESRTVAAGIIALVNDEEIVERSVWQNDGGTLLPLSYSYRRSGGDRERNISVDFDWENSQAENTASGHSWRMPVPAGTLDKLSYVLVLMKDLAENKTELRYQIADGGRLKVYQLKIEGEERIDTELGPMETVVVRRLRNSEERETLLWCAKKFNYLPVMIEHRERDGTVLWRIESFKQQ